MPTSWDGIIESLQLRQVKYLNNLVEQDNRGVKRVTRPMLGFKSFDAAQSTIVGIELVHMLRKGQLKEGVEQASPWPNSSTPWPHNPPTNGVDSPRIVHSRKFATKPVYGVVGVAHLLGRV